MIVQQRAALSSLRAVSCEREIELDDRASDRLQLRLLAGEEPVAPPDQDAPQRARRPIPPCFGIRRRSWPAGTLARQTPPARWRTSRGPPSPRDGRKPLGAPSALARCESTVALSLT